MSAGSDPLGLTTEQRSVSELWASADAFMDMVRANLEAMDRIPDGTLVPCDLPGCGPHPIEMYR